MTTIKKCDCKHPFQDRRYGRGRRVHNAKQSGAARCTVCNKER